MITKTTTVEKDPEGKILKRIEVEKVQQRLSTRNLVLEYIKVEIAPEVNDAAYQPDAVQRGRP